MIIRDMARKVTLDQAGRVVLPKAFRDRLNLSAGDTLDFSIVGDAMTLRPRRGATSLERERGVWVFRDGNRLTAAETSEALQNSRGQAPP